MRCELCTENNHHWSLCFKHNNQNRNKTKPSSPTENNQLNVDSAGTPDSGHNTTRRPNSLHIQYTSISYKSRTRDDYAPMVVAEIKTGDGRWVKANCSLDTGSNSSLVRMKFAKQTKLHSCGTSDVEFNVAGGGVHREYAEQFEIHIRPIQSNKSNLILTTGIKKPCSRVEPTSSEIFTEHEHLREYEDRICVNGGEIDVLIGNDYAPLIVAGKCVSSPSNPDKSPSVALTQLGCYVYGGLNNSSARVINNVLSVNFINRIETEELKTFFYNDVIGVKPTSVCACSDSEIAESAFIKHVRATTSINEDGRVCVKMPWKPG